MPGLNEVGQVEHAISTGLCNAMRMLFHPTKQGTELINQLIPSWFERTDKKNE